MVNEGKLKDRIHQDAQTSITAGVLLATVARDANKATFILPQ